MGLLALAITQLAEFGLGWLLRGLSPTAQLERFATPPGLISAAALQAFLAMPVIMNRRPG